MLPAGNLAWVANDAPVRALALARVQMRHLEPRWTHVRAVARASERLCKSHGLPENLLAAAWLHDIGYAPQIVETGCHAIDGARYLRRARWSEAVVSLVAYHSGASFEAAERGLSLELADFAEPAQDLQDILTLVDMTTSPTGDRVSVDERLSEILARYPADDPVHRAVTRSGPILRESAARAAAALGLSDVRGVPVL